MTKEQIVDLALGALMFAMAALCLIIGGGEAHQTLAAASVLFGSAAFFASLKRSVVACLTFAMVAAMLMVIAFVLSVVRP